jgi:hypothetical protein
MALSADTLFHFTKYEHLTSIIANRTFYPRYSFELLLNDENHIVAIPMVCFCDIPLSQIYPHAVAYHKNGIGLSKEWGRNSGINPVFYLQQKSRPFFILREILSASKFIRNQSGQVAMIADNAKALRYYYELLTFFKPREGKTWDRDNATFVQKNTAKGPLDKIFNFYDEREWRFVPDNQKESTSQSIPINFIPKEFLYDGQGNFLNDRFESFNKIQLEFALPFNPDQVKYIIVDRKDKINRLVEFIKNLGKETYTEAEKNLLYTKIISLTQIRKDF